MPVLPILITLLTAIIILLVIAAFYNRLTVTEYNICSDKISKTVKIVFLTDLHSCKYGKSQQELIERIDEQNPDIIMMSGDIMDDVLPDIRTIEFLEGIKNKYPCYYVTGNHEIWSGRVEEQKNMFRSYGVVVLEGDCADIVVNEQNLSICGIDDPVIGKDIWDKQWENISSIINPERYCILLSHRPELFEDYYADYDFDLALTGHAHGGQWRIPLILKNGLLAPHQGLFPKYTNGIYERNKTKMLVSRGLARESTRVPRIYNPPELIVINLLPNSAE